MRKIIKHFKTIAFFLGVSLDLFFLPKVTSPYYLWVGIIDISLVFVLILIRQSIRGYLHRKIRAIKREIGLFQDRHEIIREKTGILFSVLEKINSSITYMVSFFLGTFLAHILVYYFRSSDVLQVWPIFVIVGLSILSNEFLYGIIPDILLFFVALTLYIIFNIPLFLHKVNNNTFLISILVSAIVISILTVILQRIFLSKKDFLFLIIFSIAFPFLILKLYYLNYIPAVPLALGDSGFYSNVEKHTNDQNIISYNKNEEGILKTKKYFLIEDAFYKLDSTKESNTIYFFSSIISPADVFATITHLWQKYDDSKKIWIDYSRINYDISGGRQDGYRGYSNITNLTKGKWRVKVLADDRVVGVKDVEVN